MLSLLTLKKRFGSKKAKPHIPLNNSDKSASTYEEIFYNKNPEDYSYPCHSSTSLIDSSSTSCIPPDPVKSSHKEPALLDCSTEVVAEIYEIPCDKVPVDHAYAVLTDHTDTLANNYGCPAPSDYLEAGITYPYPDKDKNNRSVGPNIRGRTTSGEENNSPHPPAQAPHATGDKAFYCVLDNTINRSLDTISVHSEDPASPTFKVIIHYQ